jgi:tetratricopeptide (TPR) repeat protein
MRTSFVLLLLGLATRAHPGKPTPGVPGALAAAQEQKVDVGQVHFQTSCAQGVQADFDRAVAMLHSFWYGEAQKTFESVASRDPKCAVAYWGVAMTKYHELWGPNNVDDEGGKAAVAKGRELASGASLRERDYIEAIGAYYDGAGKSSVPERAFAYAERMQKLYAAYPKDPEAAVFCALAMIATADRSDRTFAQDKKAAEILLKVQQEQPKHPGVAHYLIHAYDSPELAQLGLPAARTYAKIAPDAPHALHMPAHTFTQLGLWDEAIATDVNAVAAARKEEAQGHEHGVGGRLHSYDFMVNAYLQLGDDAAAKKLVDETKTMNLPPPRDTSADHALAAIPARYALERRDWAMGEALTPALQSFAFNAAITYMARAIGAARLGHLPVAREEVKKLQDMEIKAVPGVRARIHIEWLIAAAALAHAEHRDEEAVDLLKTAQESVETTPGMPPAIVPCREALGELLFEIGQPQKALEQFEASERLTPGRLHTLAGAFQAARQAKNATAARNYAHRLVTMTAAVKTERPEVKEAKEFLNGGAKQGAGK